MKKLTLLLFVLLAITFSVKAQTTNKLADAQNLWAQYNAGSPADTSLFAQMHSDYSTVLSSDSTNAPANLGLGDLFNTLANYWTNMAAPLETSNPTLFSTYSAKADNYTALASPYLQRYLQLTGVTH